VKEVFVNSLSRPRSEESRSSPEYLKARDHLWRLVKGEALKAMQQNF
jgi:hypothetical protein